MSKVVLQGLDVGLVIRYRLVDEPWQYEAKVRWGNCFCCAGTEEWVPVIELSYART